jgi:tetratricopeptide (TPR) repeat protein
MFLPDLESNRRPWKRILLVLLLAAGVVAAIFGPGWYEQMKHRRAIAMAEVAAYKFAHKDTSGAMETAQSALQLDPTCPEALRVMARVLTAMGREEALGYWGAVWQGKVPPPEERDAAIGLALALRRLDVAEFYLSQALQKDATATNTLRQAAIFFELRGENARSVNAGRTYLQKQPGDGEIRLVIGRQLLASRSAEDVGEAKQLLISLSDTNNPLALTALTLLSRSSALSAEETGEVLRRLRALPGDNLGREFLVSDLEMCLQPARRPDVLAETIERYRFGGDEKLLLLARWLNGKGEFKRTLEAVPLGLATGKQELFLAYCDAVAGLGDWPGLGKILVAQKLPIPDWLAELYRARVDTELKNDREAAAHWNQAQLLAAPTPEALIHLGDYAEKVGELGEASKAYRRLVRFDKFMRQAYVSLVRVHERKSDTAELRRIMEEMVKVYPDDPAPQNDLAYLELLLGVNVENAWKTAQKLTAKYPDLIAYRTTLALADLRRKDSAGARKAYEKSTLVWDQALPAWQAVYVAVVGQLGDTNLARKLAATIPQARLKPEEKDLVRPWMAP